MRMLHTMQQIGNLEKSIDFYVNVLSMKLLHRNDYPEGKFTLAFFGYRKEVHHTVLEPTHNWDMESCDLGSGYGHIAIEVENAYQACNSAKAKGRIVTREAGPMKHGKSVIAFVQVSDDYKIEFIQKKENFSSAE